MNIEQQTTLLSTLIEQFIENYITDPKATEILDQWKAFPLKTSPHFIRILLSACKHGNMEIVKYFHKNYQHIIDQPNVRGETPLFVATCYNKLEIAKFLIDNGCSTLTTTASGDTYLHWLVCVPPSELKTQLIDMVLKQYPQLLLAKNLVEESPLHIAALVGDMETVKKLIDNGAKPMEKTTRFIDAYEYSLLSGNVELVTYLYKFRKAEKPTNVCGLDSRPSKSPKQPEESAEDSDAQGLTDSSGSGSASTKSSLAKRKRARRMSGSHKTGEAGESFSQGSFEQSQLGSALQDYFSNGTNIEALYDKFQGYEKDGDGKKKKKSKKGEQGIAAEVSSIMQEYFTSKKMLEIPNVFGRGKKYRIISLDGGGIKAILELIILQKLLNEFPHLLEECNLYCGCSASSFIVTLITMGVSIEGIIKLFEVLFRYAFKKDTVAPVTAAKYSQDNLKVFCDTCFGSLRIKSLPRHVLIPAFLIHSGDKVDKNGDTYCKAEAFNNIIEENGDELMADICIRSAAAPTYFKPYQNYVDGGIVDNHPCGMCWPYLFGETGLNLDKKDVVCLSISAGRPNPRHLDMEKLGGCGVAQWALQLAPLFQFARRDESEKEAKMFLGDRYLRVDPLLPGRISLDDVNDFEDVKEVARNYPLDHVRKWIREYWY